MTGVGLVWAGALLLKKGGDVQGGPVGMCVVIIPSYLQVIHPNLGDIQDH